MQIIISAILITIFVGLCCYCISANINKELQQELDKTKKLNNQILTSYQNECIVSDSLYKILKQIKSQLSLLGLPECPEDELKRIPFEIVGWIEQLIMIEEERNSGLHK